jgi:hypothetical protein
VAGAEGFVRDQMTATIPPVEEEEAPLPAVSFSLWPKPDHVGFYGKGPDKLIEVGPTKVIALGSDLTEIHGVRDILNVELPKADPNEFLFMSTIRASEISQLDLKIHKLRYQESVPFKAITGEEMIEPKFWVADVEIPFTLRGLYADDVFVIKTDAPLPPEVYAFVHQGILTKTDPGSLERFPAEQREVFPFEIK